MASSARQLLLDRIIGHVATSGMSNASLRELADAVGSSHRMLIYHFGSREGVVAAIVATIEAQQRAALQQLAEHARTPTEIVTAQWAQLSDPALRPFIRLFFEVLALAFHERAGTEGFLAQLTTPWLDVAEDIARRLEIDLDRDELRLGVAVVRGLLIDALASGDYQAPTASLKCFLAMWENSRVASRAPKHARPGGRAARHAHADGSGRATSRRRRRK